MKYMPIRIELHKFNHANALFVGWDKNRGWGNRLTSRSVQRFIKYYVDKAKIKEKITPHCFRHGWAHKRRDQTEYLSNYQIITEGTTSLLNSRFNQKRNHIRVSR